MKGNISLKNFILGVKQELQEASAEGSKNPFLELTQVELEAEFGLETSGGVEGGFSFFVKASAEAGASQSHKVKLIFSPISNSTMMFAVPPTDTTDQSDPDTGTPPRESKPIGPTFDVIPTVIGIPNRLYPNPLGPYFLARRFGFDQEKEIDEIVGKAIQKLDLPKKGGGVSGEGDA